MKKKRNFKPLKRGLGIGIIGGFFAGIIADKYFLTLLHTAHEWTRNGDIIVLMVLALGGLALFAWLFDF